MCIASLTPKIKLAFIAVCAAAAFAPQALAKDCGSYGFDGSENYTAATIRKSTGKVHFKDDAGKEQTTYLLPGDEVVVLSKEKDSSCAVYVSNKFAETAGWLPNADLSALPATNTASAWHGTFVRDELGSISKLKVLKNGHVEAMIEAYWAMSVELAKQGGVNVGDLGGDGELKDGALHIAPDSSDNSPTKDNCAGDVRRIGTRYLLVEDNRDKLPSDEILTCAGHNVGFTGLYIKKK